MDNSEWQSRAMTAHGGCPACKTSKSLPNQRHVDIIETHSKSFPSTGFQSGSNKPERTSGSTTDRHFESHLNAKNTLSGRTLLLYNDHSLTTLRARCQRLEQDNATLLNKITEMEDEGMKHATQHLQRYDRAGRNVLAVQRWADRQVQEAQQDLEKIGKEGQEHLTALRGQLEVVEGKLQEAQRELQLLREYRDCGHSAAVLQAAELERQLRILSETHQDQAADVEDLAQSELQKLLDRQQNKKGDALQDIVRQHIEHLPLSVRRMHAENLDMKQDIQAYQQMVADLHGDVLDLQESGDALSKSWKEESETFCRDLLLGKPRCSPDEDVILDIPLRQKLLI